MKTLSWFRRSICCITPPAAALLPSTEELTPTVSVGPYHVLELFRGPTSAFKDVALSMLPQLLTAAKTVKGMEENILILTATSGDTGKAALRASTMCPG